MNLIYERNLTAIWEILGVTDTKKVNVQEWLVRATLGKKTTPEEILTRMMSADDIVDLKEGRIPFENLKCHVKVWCEIGKPDQNQ